MEEVVKYGTGGKVKVVIPEPSMEQMNKIMFGSFDEMHQEVGLFVGAVF